MAPAETMLALVFDEPENKLKLEQHHPVPVPGPEEALVQVIRAGICSTDIELTRGYVPGYNAVLGHEFVGRVVSCASQPGLVGKRVVGEINCNICNFTCADAIYQRNHAPGRTVLGIIGKDGAMAEYLTLPASNLHLVPNELTDLLACYCEPLAAACRILEQKLPLKDSKVAVIGDGKLGLLIAAVLTAAGQCAGVTLLGRHHDKMKLVEGCTEQRVVDDTTQDELQGMFDMVVEASGSSRGIKLALALLRPMGHLVLKTTVSLLDKAMPGWSDLANDIVVNEKVLVGSRCGPMDMALQVMQQHAAVRKLLEAMTTAVVPLREAESAMVQAQTKGCLKVQLLCSESP